MTTNDSSSNSTINKEPHHERQELCRNRVPYRQGRKLTAVKVYTVSDESRHLLIQGVPAISVTAELENLCLTYGSIEHLKHLPDYPSEKFCETYQATFRTIQSARFAKRKMDDKSFYGGTLHVCYAPELETIEDTRQKLETRQKEIAQRLNPNVFRIGKANNSSATNSAVKDPTISDEAGPNNPPTLNEPEEKSESVSLKPQSSEIIPPKPPIVKRIVYHQPNKKRRLSADTR